MKNIIYSLLILFIITSCAIAQDSIVLSLETPKVGKTASSVTKSTPQKQKDVKQVEEKRVGRVGVVAVDNTIIYKTPSEAGARFCKVSKETPIVVINNKNDFYCILMSNGATGYILQKDVSLVDYDLIVKQDKNQSSLASRGDYSRFEDYCNLIKTAMTYKDVRYVYGGTNPSTGMDCSAFVRMVFGQYGLKLPRTAREQANVGQTVPFDQLKPGDRLYFMCKKSYIDHCGIYAGDGYFIHCSVTKNGVAFDKLTNSFFLKSLVVAKRS